MAGPNLIFGSAVPHFEFTVIYTSCYPAKYIDHDGVVFQQMVIFVVMYVVPLVIMAFVYSHIAYVLCWGDIPGESRK